MPPKKQENAEAALKKTGAQLALKRDKTSVSPLGGGGPLGRRSTIAPRLAKGKLTFGNLVSALRDEATTSQASAPAVDPIRSGSPERIASDQQDGGESASQAAGQSDAAPGVEQSTTGSEEHDREKAGRNAGQDVFRIPSSPRLHEESSGESDFEDLILSVVGEDLSTFNPARPEAEEESARDEHADESSSEAGGRGDVSPDVLVPSHLKFSRQGSADEKATSHEPDKEHNGSAVRNDQGRENQEPPAASQLGRSPMFFEHFVRLIWLCILHLWEMRFALLGVDGQKAKFLPPILITPLKRMERDAIKTKSSKRVHFKLRKKSQVEQFKPFEKDSAIVQNWLIFMILPLTFDVFAFGLRLAVCDIFLGKVMVIYYVDIICDVIKLMDVGMALVTAVPKGTYPRQGVAARTLPAIASLYLRHEMSKAIGPTLLYQLTCWVLISLPHTDENLANAEIFIWVWWLSMLPRFISNSLRLYRYSVESVIDPKVTRNIKLFQFGRIVVIILASSHLVGCAYYLVARLYKFDESTWIHAVEEAMPLYRFAESETSSEYLLLIFKGFCRIASLRYDPGLPGNIPELILGLAVMFLSVWITSMILGTLLTFLVRRDPMEVAHKERIEALRVYMLQKHVPPDLFETVIRYCNFQYNKNRNSDAFAEASEMFKSLSRSLRIEVANANHRDLVSRCSKIGRPLHRCSNDFLNDLVVKLTTVHVMPGDILVHKDEIPRELYFVASGTVQIVDEHDQILSVIRSDVPDTAPIVGEVPFFLGINYIKAMKASLERDVQLQVLSKLSLVELQEEFPEDINCICDNLRTQYEIGKDGNKHAEESLDQEKLLTKKRILESSNFRKEQLFNALCKAARQGNLDTVVLLHRHGANLNQIDYDGRTAMHMASADGKYRVVECLLKLKADCNVKDRWGRTPMAIAIHSKEQLVITVLAAAKAKLDIENPELELCTAAGSGDQAQVKRLIDFGVSPNSGDYDLRTALHVAAAEGHEKIVEYLLVAHADPNCKDRWGGTPLQDALAGGHFGAAHLLKAKGAAVPESFGAEAVCTAAGKGDVPKLRMLHSFGQSLDVGDYDERYALHLASAEGRVLAVSFLLGISADPNVKDRWSGTPMDDCLRGGTLYHMYCAKLLQAWGGELGATLGQTKEGAQFLAALSKISIKDIREVIRKLIDQGLDKVCPERMDDQQLLVVMSATIRHMPLVTQLHKNTAVITKEITNFRKVVWTFVEQIRENIESALSALLRGKQSMPDVEDDIMDEVDLEMAYRRPKSARQARIVLRTEHNKKIDRFSGIHKEENSRVLDSNSLESPVHSHEAVGYPRRLARKLQSTSPKKDTIFSAFDEADDDHSGEVDFDEFCEMARNKGKSKEQLRIEFDRLDFNKDGSISKKEFLMQAVGDYDASTPLMMGQAADEQLLNLDVLNRTKADEVQFASSTMKTPSIYAASPMKTTSIFAASPMNTPGVFGVGDEQSNNEVAKRNSQRADSMVKTIFDSTVPPTVVRECFQLLKKADKKKFKWMTEATEGLANISSDEEDELHRELDSITTEQELAQEAHTREDHWQKTGAKIFNQLALNIVNTEVAYMLLHHILCHALPMGKKPPADPLLLPRDIARGLVVAKVGTRKVNLDKCFEEAHNCIKSFRLLQTPIERRENKDKAGGMVRFSTLVAASPTFRNAILEMDVDRKLCLLMQSKLSRIFNEDQARILLRNSRRETKAHNEVLHNDNFDYDRKFLTVIIEGEVTVIRTLDEDEIGRGKCTTRGCYFGAWKALNQPDGVPENEQELPFKEGGNGVNNCLIKAETSCDIIKIPVNNLNDVLPHISEDLAGLFNDKMLEKLVASHLKKKSGPDSSEQTDGDMTASDARQTDQMNLEALNNLLEAGHDSSMRTIEGPDATGEEWSLPLNQRKYHKGVPELERQAIQDSFAGIQNLWRHLARGANTVPKGSVDMIKEFLGESGLQCYDTVFAPMQEPTASLFFNAETFWYCWIKFLAKFLAEEFDGPKLEEMNEEEDDEIADEGGGGQKGTRGVLNLTINNAYGLPAMDTFTGKADPYLIVHVEGVSQKTLVQSSTLEPTWNDKMQFNCFAGKTAVKVDMFDSESMGQDRSMGSFSFVVSASPATQSVAHKLAGILADGRPAQGAVNCQVSFRKGLRVAKTVEQLTEFQHFYKTENWRDWMLSVILPSRSIEKAFFRVPLHVHEREFTKAVGTLAKPMTGLQIKQYLTYLLVEHSHQVDVYCAREFCSFFKRSLDDETAIMYRDIVKLIKERNSDARKAEIFMDSVLNPRHWMMRIWDIFSRLLSLYHIFMVPVRIGFQSESYTMMSPFPLSTDGPADILLCLHLVLSLNMAYRNSKSQWVTKRSRIFKNMDFIAVLAVMPLDWVVFLSGLDSESAAWCRLNKMLLYFAKCSPKSLIYSTRGASLMDLLIQFGLICHIGSCIYYYIGRKIPQWHLGKVNQISWLHADPSLDIGTYDRETIHAALFPGSTHSERYILSLYWVVATATSNEQVGDLTPQNYAEILYSIFLLLVNLTIFRWIQGEIASHVMNADDRVIRNREEQDRILKFISVKSFTSDLRERIQSHFLAISGNVSEEQDRLLSTLSHGLRVELARWTWRDFLAKVNIFRGCSGQFLDAVCVMLQESHYGPEEILGNAGEVSSSLVILVYGALETYNMLSPKVKKMGRKGSSVGALSFFFGVRQYSSTRAARTGAICIRISGEGMREVLQIYPADEERVKQNTLNYYSKEKHADGTSVFSAHSSEHSDDSHDSRNDDGKSMMSKTSANSGDSQATKASKSSRKSNKSKSSQSTHEDAAASVAQSAQKSANETADDSYHEGGGDTDSINPSDALDGGGAKAKGDTVDEEEGPLIKETDHIPIIKDRIMTEKIAAILTASARGETAKVQEMLESGDLTFACKDRMGRTPLHIASSEGHEDLVKHLLSLKADPTAKDKLGNTPFNDCVRSKHDNVVSLMRKDDPNISFKLGGNETGVLMCQAAFHNNIEDIKRLVVNGVDPNESDYDGRTALHLAASQGNITVMTYLIEVKANIMCRDRFNGTPLEDAVRHHFETQNADQVQKLLRDNGASLAGEGLNYVVKMCDYAAQGKVEHIRLLVTNGVDVSLGDYDDRTPLHLAACNGNTAVLEYLLEQESVLINAVDRFGGMPYQDAVRHGRKGAAAVLEEAGCLNASSGSTNVIKEMIEQSRLKKEARERKEREPKIQHVLENSQESKMVATISDKLSKEIANQSSQIELISHRLIWALKGFGNRLFKANWSIPYTDKAFMKSSQHLVALIKEMRASVNRARSTLIAEMSGDEGAADCLIWRNASLEYKRQATELDDQLRELIVLAKVANRMLKEVIRVCNRGERKALYEEAIKEAEREQSELEAAINSSWDSAEDQSDDPPDSGDDASTQGLMSIMRRKSSSPVRRSSSVAATPIGRSTSLTSSPVRLSSSMAASPTRVASAIRVHSKTEGSALPSPAIRVHSKTGASALASPAIRVHSKTGASALTSSVAVRRNLNPPPSPPK